MIKGRRRLKNDPAEIGSVETALALLDLFERVQSVRVTDVSRALSVSSSSAHRLLTTFQNHGFLMQDRAHGPYTVGPKLTRLAAGLSTRMDVVSATWSVMVELARELDETVCVGVLDGPNVIFVAAEHARRPGATMVPKNMTLPTHASAAGKALIADFHRAEIERLFPSENLRRFTSKTLASRESLLRDLQRTRERGYAVHLEESQPHYIAYACAIRDLTGAARAALVVVGPAQRFRRYSPDAIAATLRSAARGANGFSNQAK